MIHAQTRLPHPYGQVAGAGSQGVASGGIRKTTDQTIGAVGVGYAPITAYTATVFGADAGVDTELASGTLAFLKAGHYTLTVNLAMTLTPDNNSSRTMNWRLFNVTDGVAVPEAFSIIHIGAYADGASGSYSAMVGIPTGMLNKAMRLEIGGGSVFDGVVLNAALLAATSIGSV